MSAELATIKNKIYSLRGIQVMLDSDLAELYGVELKRLNEQVKRNLDRFPESFRFQLNEQEYASLRSQFATLETGRGKHAKYLPYAFTEQGVSMLSAVLHSKTAIEISIKIMDTFVQMRKTIAEHSGLIQRLESLESRQIQQKEEADRKFDVIFNALELNDTKPKQGVFFDGQVFDAYVFIAELIKKAKKSIVLIDNYVDESVLLLLAKRDEDVSAVIYTKEITRNFSLDINKHNAQYPHIEVKVLKSSHDRFLILDDSYVYHIGASLKDLGKKWFAVSKFDIDSFEILSRLSSSLKKSN
jgi:phage regulator Rha-like protein